MSDEKIHIAIPEGKLLDEVLPMLQASGLYLGRQESDDAKQVLESPFSEVSVHVIATQQVPRMLSNKNGGADIGIVSSEVFLEEWAENWQYARDLQIAKRRLSLITKADSQLQTQSTITVATRYPLIAKAHLAVDDVEVIIVDPALNGSMIDSLDRADVLIDVIDDATSLKPLGLVESRRICPVSAHAMASAHTMNAKRDQIDYVLNRMMSAKDFPRIQTVAEGQIYERGAA